MTDTFSDWFNLSILKLLLVTFKTFFLNFGFNSDMALLSFKLMIKFQTLGGGFLP